MPHIFGTRQVPSEEDAKAIGKLLSLERQQLEEIDYDLSMLSEVNRQLSRRQESLSECIYQHKAVLASSPVDRIDFLTGHTRKPSSLWDGSAGSFNFDLSHFQYHVTIAEPIFIFSNLSCDDNQVSHIHALDRCLDLIRSYIGRRILSFASHCVSGSLVVGYPVVRRETSLSPDKHFTRGGRCHPADAI